ncbi:DUF1501 domain-containing protein [Actinomycetospora sp. NBRC 106378]|uniref:DUF1501 domain-containing protein n=1 Tax=Actinomycetospora sp. NBRC 106378 TaxID=3032208 RepID=UPI0024A0D93F|nr:DUF1501 domain-containing protein [Actinomycetospora sp. NBRC 106378]GLZ51702.1 hypothetical protein Acsp07_13190 [Actinomycetospora sp. NBRC 106378]
MRSPWSTTVPVLTRRRFLAATAVTGAAAIGATAIGWEEIAGSAGDLDPDAGVLVVVTLYGGNDGLNTVIPAGDDVYQRSRPELAYRSDEVLDLGDGLGFNPALRGLKGLYDDGSLAVVQGVGYPQPDHSHFRSMAIWQTANPTSPNGAGWLGRWLDATSDGSAADPLRALSTDPVLPPLLVGDRYAGSTIAAGALELPKGPLGNAVAALASPDLDDEDWRARTAASIGHLATLRRTTTAAMQRAGKDNPTGDLDRQLQLIAALIEARVPTRVYSASLGGFDTHADERRTQERLLGQLDTALAPFITRLEATDPGRQVVVMVHSEFGRRVKANGSDGTDHGTAGPVLLAGTPVTGGLTGQTPSLTDLDGGDLRSHVDFRDLYATLTENVLGAAPDQIVGGHPGRFDNVLA